ncbi:hypothetical protein [Mesoplasma melaleucae]|uniref:Uncharacterized protein n=1 Tax=Mesoplasma melaleucae TaxID=81459 RepID=A0A2K8NZX3_9MOLU|nr:hypothetical protein [Mesoplasma melaleucae]ATZ18291.1 hypothetical protein EMELA_v1c08040 [Mesoplasma melaleucae]
MLRRIIKLDEDGKEMVDEDGQYVFEEIEIPDAKSSEEDSTDSTEDDQVLNESADSVDEVDEVTEEAADSNPEPIEENPWKEKIRSCGLTDEEIYLLIQRFQANLNAESAIEKIDALPDEKKQKILLNLGVNLKDKTIN